MKANAGGKIDPEHVVGRGRLIQNLWRDLESQSIVLVAERRMGKTCVLEKMDSDAAPGYRIVRRDVEGLQGPLEFVERFYADVEDLLPRLTQGMGKFRKLYEHFQGAKLGGVVQLPPALAQHWKPLLESIFEDIAAHHPAEQLVFMWDELPLLLQKISRSEGDAVAMELLDALRAARQTHRNLRMIFAGSIGMHHVTSSLRRAGHANDATNDMLPVEVTELEREHARGLAQALIDGEGLSDEAPGDTAAAIADAVDCVPYYIHHVIKTLSNHGHPVNPALVESVVAKALVDQQGAWHLEHYEERIGTYYGVDAQPLILHILDEVAAADSAVTFEQLRNSINSTFDTNRSSVAEQIIGGDQQLLRHYLKLLQRDHYLAQEPDRGRYRFRFPLIRRWWRIHRNLES